jgi:hypothetical protein
MSEGELLRINSPDDIIINKSYNSLTNTSPGSKGNGKVILFSYINR